MLYGKVNCIKNWGRIHIVSRATDIVISTNHISIRNRLKWTQAVIDSLNNIGICGDSRNELVHKTAMKRMSDIFHQETYVRYIPSRSVCPIYSIKKRMSDIFHQETYVRYIPSRSIHGNVCPIYSIKKRMSDIFHQETYVRYIPSRSIHGNK